MNTCHQFTRLNHLKLHAFQNSPQDRTTTIQQFVFVHPPCDATKSRGIFFGHNNSMQHWPQCHYTTTKQQNISTNSWMHLNKKIKSWKDRICFNLRNILWLLKKKFWINWKALYNKLSSLTTNFFALVVDKLESKGRRRMKVFAT
jgi:hypothetical protein